MKHSSRPIISYTSCQRVVRLSADGRPVYVIRKKRRVCRHGPTATRNAFDSAGSRWIIGAPKNCAMVNRSRQAAEAALICRPTFDLSLKTVHQLSFRRRARWPKRRPWKCPVKQVLKWKDPRQERSIVDGRRLRFNCPAGEVYFRIR